MRHEKNPGRYPEPSDLTYEGRRYNRYTAAFTLDDYSDLLRFFPHIHIVCYGKFRDAREFQKVTGWNYENYSGNSKKDRALRSRGAVEKTLWYLSSHMPILKGAVRPILGMPVLSSAEMREGREGTVRTSVPALWEWDEGGR